MEKMRRTERKESEEVLFAEGEKKKLLEEIRKRQGEWLDQVKRGEGTAWGLRG
jgi:hypothetical protein